MVMLIKSSAIFGHKIIIALVFKNMTDIFPKNGLHTYIHTYIHT
jgi:hypothetical protein